VSLYAISAFQKVLDSPSHFSKANSQPISLFKSCERIPEYLSINKKKGIKKLQKDPA